MKDIILWWMCANQRHYKIPLTAGPRFRFCPSLSGLKIRLLLPQVIRLQKQSRQILQSSSIPTVKQSYSTVHLLPHPTARVRAAPHRDSPQHCSFPVTVAFYLWFSCPPYLLFFLISSYFHSARSGQPSWPNKQWPWLPSCTPSPDGKSVAGWLRDDALFYGQLDRADPQPSIYQTAHFV